MKWGAGGNLSTYWPRDKIAIQTNGEQLKNYDCQMATIQVQLKTAKTGSK